MTRYYASSGTKGVWKHGKHYYTRGENRYAQVLLHGECIADASDVVNEDEHPHDASDDTSVGLDSQTLTLIELTVYGPEFEGRTARMGDASVQKRTLSGGWTYLHGHDHGIYMFRSTCCATVNVTHPIHSSDT